MKNLSLFLLSSKYCFILSQDVNNSMFSPLFDLDSLTIHMLFLQCSLLKLKTSSSCFILLFHNLNRNDWYSLPSAKKLLEKNCSIRNVLRINHIPNNNHLSDKKLFLELMTD